MYGLARPFLFGLDAERAHGIGLASLEAAYRTGTSPLLARRPKPLPTRAFGMTFRNPVGLAAGLDKNGAHIDALLSRSEEHTSEIQSLMRNTYAVFCLTKKK